MAELLVVADDLTGATDTGVQFAQRGRPTRVLLDRGAPLQEDARKAAVLVVDTRSRHEEPTEAAARVASVVRRGREAGIRRFFKKTDSALRGNLGSELQALMEASGSPQVAFLPAFPALGRTTRDGVQYVHGRALHETEFASDPLGAVRARSVLELLRQQTHVPVLRLSASALDGATAVNSPGILVFDSESDEEMRRIVASLRARGKLGAVAGTAALARVLAELDGHGATAASGGLAEPPLNGPMLVVGGSLHRSSLAQLEHAAAHGFATVALNPSLLVSDEPGGPECDDVVARTVALLQEGTSVLLRSGRGAEDVRACVDLGAAMAITQRDVHLRVARSTGLIARRVLDGHPVGALAVLGGDTFAGLMHALGNPTLLPRRELLPGIPLSAVEGFEKLRIVSKAGGFGSPSALVEIADILRRGPQ
ncbi:MAG: four-carbon acid sugar kinase family protein [Gemmatimonadetes bacterium]|nr:four-carbon acid sugar kinase family protein [Gemmatimonadota bacterium]